MRKLVLFIYSSAVGLNYFHCPTPTALTIVPIVAPKIALTRNLNYQPQYSPLLLLHPTTSPAILLAKSPPCRNHLYPHYLQQLHPCYYKHYRPYIRPSFCSYYILLRHIFVPNFAVMLYKLPHVRALKNVIFRF